MGFYNIGSRGTISSPEEGDFDPESVCKKIHDGMKGLGTDENAIVETLPKHTNEQRQEIKKKYKTMYGKDLVEEVEKELGGSFAKVVLALLQEPEEFIIDCVHRSVEGLGTDEYSLIGLLCVRSNDELAEMKTQYKEKHGKEMEEDIADELSGDLKFLITGLINGGREESEGINEEKVKQDAKDLLDAASGVGTKEEVFAAIFNQRSASHMREVFDAYKEIADGKELEETIESEFSGNLQNAYLAQIKIFRNVVAFHAERLRAALKGAGTDDDALIQILVTRSEIDLKDILEFYEGKYDSRLVDDVSADTSGDYGVILQRILDESPTEQGEEEATGGAAAEEAPAEVEEAAVEADAAAESESAPGEAEEAPAEAEEAPAESETAPAESEEAPAESEDAPAADSEDAPAESEDAPAETEETPAEGDEAPAEGDEAPAEKEAAGESEEAPAESEAGEGDGNEETAAEVDEAPAEAEEAPAEAEQAPTETEEVATDAAESEDAPAESEDAAAESTDAPAEDAPAESEDVAAEDAPAESEDAPAESEDAPAESEDAPAESEDAPAESEDAPAESEDAPAESEDAPAESEDTAAEAEETPAEADSTIETNAEPKENGEEEAAADGDAEKEADAADGEEAAAETEEGEAAAEGEGEKEETADGESKTDGDGDAPAEDAEAPADEKKKSDSAKVNGK